MPTWEYVVMQPAYFYMPLYYLSNIRKATLEVKSDKSLKIGF